MGTKHFESEELELGCLHQNEGCKVNKEAEGGSYSQQLGGDCMSRQESNAAEATELLEKGLMEYGCSHYRRNDGLELLVVVRSLIVATVIMRQRTISMLTRSSDMIYHAAKLVRSYVHYVAQNKRSIKSALIVAYAWGNISASPASFLMMIQASKKQYHCDGCGICRIGGRENFFHCYKCGCCYSVLLKTNHPCVEGAMHHDCPVCFEFLFESRYDVTVLPCGHTIHTDCLKEMRDHFQYACPLCSKSVCDMSKVWEKFDEEIAATPMPEPYQNKMVSILCNDCGKKSEVRLHVLARKCPDCRSYNTRQTRGQSGKSSCRK